MLRDAVGLRARGRVLLGRGVLLGGRGLGAGVVRGLGRGLVVVDDGRLGEQLGSVHDAAGGGAGREGVLGLVLPLLVLATVCRIEVGHGWRRRRMSVQLCASVCVCACVRVEGKRVRQKDEKGRGGVCVCACAREGR